MVGEAGMSEGRRGLGRGLSALLGEVEAGAAALDHGDGFPQMSLGAFEPIDDLGMGFVDDVGHSLMLSPWRG